MRDITVTFSDGSKVTYQGAPDDLTPDMAIERISKEYPGLDITELDGGRDPAPQTPKEVAPTAAAPAKVAPVGGPSRIQPTPEPTGPVAPPAKRQGLASDEELKFWDQAPNETDLPRRLTSEQEGDYHNFLAQNKGNPNFSQADLDQYWKSKGFPGANLAEDSFIEAIRKGEKTGGIDYSIWDKQQQEERIQAAEAFGETIDPDQSIFGREYQEAVQYGFPGMLGRWGNDFMDTGKEELRKAYPGQSDEWYEKQSDLLIRKSQRAIRDYYTKASEEDPVWKDRPGMTMQQKLIANAPRVFAGLVANLGGSVGPESALMPGATALGRTFGQAGISGVSELGYELADKAEGVSDEVSLENIAAATALGGLFQGGVEGLGKLREKGRGTPTGIEDGGEIPSFETADGQTVDRLYNTIDEDDIVQGSIQKIATKLGIEKPEDIAKAVQTEDFQKRVRADLIDNGHSLGLLDRELEPYDVAIQNALDSGASRTDIDAIASKYGEEPFGPELDQILEGRTTPEPARPDVPGQKVQLRELEAEVGELSNRWQNAPDMKLVNSASEIADPKIRKAVEKNKGIRGFYTPDGQVHIIADRLNSTDDVGPVLFHEALGHHGLAQKFGEDLDTALTDLYARSPELRKMVGEWREARPEYKKLYKGRKDRTAREIDEVLAMMSEDGPMTRTIVDKVKDVVKDYLRRVGMNLEVSEREIRSILALAHETVTKGKGAAEGKAGGGSRFMYVGDMGALNDTSGNVFGTREFAQDLIDRDPSINRQAGGTLHSVTGWFEGPDGRMRYELADDTAEVRPDWDELPSGNNAYRLDEVMSHPQLFNMYPELRDLNIVKRPGSRPEVSGWFDKGKRMIGIAPNNKAVRSTILHEVQHAIQDIEGWGRGGNPESALAATPGPQLRKIAEGRADRLNTSQKARRADAAAVDTILQPENFELAQMIFDARRRYNETYEAYGMGSELTKQSYRHMADLENTLRERLRQSEPANTDWLSTGDSNPTRTMDAIRQAEYVEGRDLTERLNIIKSRAIKDAYEDSIQELRLRDPQATPKELRDLLRYDRQSKELAYNNLLGEAEARDTEARMDLPQQARRPGASEGYLASQRIPEEDLIIDLTGAGEADSIRPSIASGPSEGKSREALLDRFIDRLDLDNSGAVIRGIADELGYDPVTDSEVIWQGKQLGWTPAKLAKMNNIPEEKAAARIVAAVKVLEAQDAKVMALQRKIIKPGGDSSENLANFSIELGKLADITEKVLRMRSAAGRALRAVKLAGGATQNPEAILSAMSKVGEGSGVANRESLIRLAQQMEDMPDAPSRSKLARDAFDPKFEDYGFSLWYNVMMLSRPSTQYNNLIGTLEHVALEYLSAAAASLAGLPKKLVGNNDRVAVREVVARTMGMMIGVFNGLANAPKAFAQGRPVTGFGKDIYRPLPIYRAAERATANSNLLTKGVVRGAAGVLELPSRLMAVPDEFFRSITALSEYYGLAMREALQGVDGTLAERFYTLTKNPTESMKKKQSDWQLPINETRHKNLDFANQAANRVTFRDEMSDFGKWVEGGLRTKHTDTPTKRVAKAGARILVPFLQIGDRIVAAMFRYNPILGMLDRYNKADWAAGGARRDVAIGRMMVGTSVLLYAALEAMNGDRSGEGPTDYERRMEMEDAGWKPNAVRNDDGSWTSKANLGPANTMANAMAGLVEKLESGELDDKSYTTAAVALTGDFVNSLAKNAGFETVQRLFGGDSGGTSSGGLKDNAAAGLASSLVTPGFMQAYNQNFGDTAQRVTSGDKSVEDRTYGRWASAFPGLSRGLPQKYDVYGRPVFREGGWSGLLTGNRKGRKEDDPVVKELQRLARHVDTGKALIDQPERTLRLGDESKKLTEEEYQLYRAWAGNALRVYTEAEMMKPEWKKMTDAEKIELVKEIKTYSRRAAKYELFVEGDEEQQGPVDPEEEIVEVEGQEVER